MAVGSEPWMPIRRAEKNSVQKSGEPGPEYCSIRHSGVVTGIIQAYRIDKECLAIRIPSNVIPRPQGRRDADAAAVIAPLLRQRKIQGIEEYCIWNTPELIFRTAWRGSMDEGLEGVLGRLDNCRH